MMNKGLLKWVANISLVLVSTSLALLLGEVCLRLIWPRTVNHHQIFCEFDSTLGWRKIPNFSAKRQTSEYSITETFNSKGIRGEDYPVPKPPGEKRVMILGDSFAEGYSVAFENLFSEHLKRNLNSDQSQRYQVINCGTGGYSTDQELLFYQMEGVHYQPDIVVLLFYFNDVWFNAQCKYWRGEKPCFKLGEDASLLPPQLPNPAAEEENKRFYEESRLFQRGQSAWKRFKRVCFGSCPTLPPDYLPFLLEPNVELNQAWQVTEALLANLHQTAKSNGAQLLVTLAPPQEALDTEAYRQFVKEYCLSETDLDIHRPTKELEKICQRLDISFFDPTSCFIKEMTDEKTSLYFPKDAHWNPAGHRLMGRLLADFLSGKTTRCP